MSGVNWKTYTPVFSKFNKILSHVYYDRYFNKLLWFFSKGKGIGQNKNEILFTVLHMPCNSVDTTIQSMNKLTIQYISYSETLCYEFTAIQNPKLTVLIDAPFLHVYSSSRKTLKKINCNNAAYIKKIIAFQYIMSTYRIWNCIFRS
jgi:hypothetical protein